MKRQRRLTHNQAFAYFVTATLSGFAKLFDQNRYADVLIRDLNFYREKLEFRLLAFVIMPDHIHLIIQPSPKASISEIVRDFKKYTAKEIIHLLEEEKRSGVLDLFREAAQRYHSKESRGYQVWEDRFDDVALYSDEVFRTKLNYIHNNAVKAGLVDNPSDYPYSSARNYNLGDHSIIQVDCEIGFSSAGGKSGNEQQVRSGDLTLTVSGLRRS